MKLVCFWVLNGVDIYGFLFGIPHLETNRFQKQETPVINPWVFNRSFSLSCFVQTGKNKTAAPKCCYSQSYNFHRQVSHAVARRK